MTETKPRRARTNKVNKREQLTQELSTKVSLGEIVSFFLDENRGIVNKHSQVIAALKDSNLDEKFAREFSNTQAFNRALSIMEKEERVIEVIRNDKDDVLFQFTKSRTANDAADGDEMLEYFKEAKVLLNKFSGEILCKVPEIQERARTELDRCLQDRTTTDITTIVNRLFQSKADLIKFATGTYFVPKEHLPFVDKVHKFMKALGRNIRRLSIPKGEGDNDATVQETMAKHFKDMLEELESDVEGFSLTTRQGTVEGAVERINSNRAKIKAYGSYLHEKSEELLGKTDHLTRRLVEKLKTLEEERKTAPASERGSNRDRVFSCLNGSPKTTKELCEEAGTNTNGIAMFLDDLVKKGRAVKVGSGYAKALDVV